MITLHRKKSLRGLTRDEVERRQHEYGLNRIAEKPSRPLRLFLSKFWGPIPWMLEATIVLQLMLGKTVDCFIIVVLLLVNAVIGFSFERRARGALALLKGKLRIQSRALRDGKWKLIPAQELVPGDVVRLRMGGIIPADALLLDGEIAVDQSSLTGESGLVELEPGMTAYAASVIRRGEAVAEISATGMNTSYSKTAQLVQAAKPADHGDAFIQRIVIFLLSFTFMLALAVLIEALRLHLGLPEVVVFILALLVAAIPVSLPVTFTLASAVGARDLARHNVLTTRLSAIKEAAGMDVLCTDKTGTITQNELTVVGVQPFGSFSKSKLLRLAALASDEATHDPVDSAILKAARAAKRHYPKAERLEFTPFDPATKRTEALVSRDSKRKKRVRVLKGAPQEIYRLARCEIDPAPEVVRLTAEGNRCIAIAAGKPGKRLKLVGLLALQDRPRDDAQAVVSQLQGLGVRVVMITGDDVTTASSVARNVGITGDVCPADALRENVASSAEAFDVFARVYPEDKYRLVQALQDAGHVVGMTGDGINDAPAIRQAEIGIAVNNATDITKSAASLVLTAHGLKDMLTAVEIGRSVFQRLSTYTLNKMVKTFHLGLFLSLGLILTGGLVAQPIHILLMVLANDLVSISLTTDRVRPSRRPERWRPFPLIASALVMALGWLAYSFVIYLFGRDGLHLSVGQLYTLTFLMLVAVSQANVYLVREQRSFWKSRPSRWMLLATAVDLVIVGILAWQGILMDALAPNLILALFAATVGFMIGLDGVKVLAFRLLRYGRGESSRVRGRRALRLAPANRLHLRLMPRNLLSRLHQKVVNRRRNRGQDVHVVVT